MKKISLALAGAALVGISPAFADNTDTNTVSVSGTIVASLTVSAGSLTMPHIVRPKAALSVGASPSSGTGTVQVACSSAGATTVTYSAGVNPFANGTASATAVAGSSANKGVPGANFTGTCAALTVTGEANYFFLTTVGAGTSPITGVSITGTTCSPGSSNVQLSGAGSATVYCGATVQVTSAAAAGAYTGSFPVTVTYD